MKYLKKYLLKMKKNNLLNYINMKKNKKNIEEKYQLN